MALVNDMTDGAKLTGDIFSASIVIGTLTQLLPAIAAILTILWTALRIYETFLKVRQLRRAERDTSSAADS